MKKGAFIVLEGPDKSGKSTQAGLIARYLRLKKIPFIHTREPGGTSFAEAIRRILLKPGPQVDPVAELLLYEAARAQHTREKLLPALQAGKAVLCERYTLATLAYQGYARGLSLPLIRNLNFIATQGLKPDITFLLDIPESSFDSREQNRRHDRLEQEPRRFRRQVRAGYLAAARKDPKIVLLNGRLDVKEVHRRMLKILDPLLSCRRP